MKRAVLFMVIAGCGIAGLLWMAVKGLGVPPAYVGYITGATQTFASFTLLERMA